MHKETTIPRVLTQIFKDTHNLTCQWDDVQLTHFHTRGTGIRLQPQRYQTLSTLPGAISQGARDSAARTMMLPV